MRLRVIQQSAKRANSKVMATDTKKSSTSKTPTNQRPSRLGGSNPTVIMKNAVAIPKTPKQLRRFLKLSARSPSERSFKEESPSVPAPLKRATAEWSAALSPRYSLLSSHRLQR